MIRFLAAALLVFVLGAHVEGSLHGHVDDACRACTALSSTTTADPPVVATGVLLPTGERIADFGEAPFEPCTRACLTLRGPPA